MEKVVVSNDTSRSYTYTVEYVDHQNERQVKTFDLAPGQKREFSQVKEGTWKVTKIDVTPKP